MWTLAGDAALLDILDIVFDGDGEPMKGSE